MFSSRDQQPKESNTAFCKESDNSHHDWRSYLPGAFFRGQVAHTLNIIKLIRKNVKKWHQFLRNGYPTGGPTVYQASDIVRMQAQMNRL